MQEKRNRTLCTKGSSKAKSGPGSGSGASTEGAESAGEGDVVTASGSGRAGTGAGPSMGGSSTGAGPVIPAATSGAGAGAEPPLRFLGLTLAPAAPSPAPTLSPCGTPAIVTTPPRRGRRRFGGQGVAPKTRVLVIADWADGAIAAVDATGDWRPLGPGSFHFAPPRTPHYVILPCCLLALLGREGCGGWVGATWC